MLNNTWNCCKPLCYLLLVLKCLDFYPSELQHQNNHILMTMVSKSLCQMPFNICLFSLLLACSLSCMHYHCYFHRRSPNHSCKQFPDLHIFFPPYVNKNTGLNIWLLKNPYRFISNGIRKRQSYHWLVDFFSQHYL